MGYTYIALTCFPNELTEKAGRVELLIIVLPYFTLLVYFHNMFDINNANDFIGCTETIAEF